MFVNTKMIENKELFVNLCPNYRNNVDAHTKYTFTKITVT
jgi:hypothetical protein